MGFSPEAVIHVEKKKRDGEYEEIHRSPRSPFRSMLLKDIFLVAMMIGYHKKAREPLKGTFHDLFRASTFNSEEEWLLKSIAITEKRNLDVLLDENEKEILKIAEEEPLHIDENTIKFSVSIGITQLKEGDDKNTIIKRADRAMYLAKDKGSNKTKVLI